MLITKFTAIEVPSFIFNLLEEEYKQRLEQECSRELAEEERMRYQLKK
jgi:hypothetical protein